MLDVLLLLLVSAGAAGQPPVAAGPARFVVITADGRSLPSRSWPVIAFGQVRYTDEAGVQRVLKTDAVDVAATRAAPANLRDPPKGTLSFDDSVAPGSSLRPTVKVYSTTWCGTCRMAKGWLAQHGIPATIVEIDRLPKGEQEAAWLHVQAASGRRAVPLVEVGGQSMLGFNADWLSRMTAPPPAEGTTSPTSGRTALEKKAPAPAPLTKPRP